MTRAEAVTGMAGIILAVRELDAAHDVEAVASVLVEALESANVRLVESRKAAGSGWRQAVQARVGEMI